MRVGWPGPRIPAVPLRWLWPAAWPRGIQRHQGGPQSADPVLEVTGAFGLRSVHGWCIWAGMLGMYATASVVHNCLNCFGVEITLSPNTAWSLPVNPIIRFSTNTEWVVQSAHYNNNSTFGGIKKFMASAHILLSVLCRYISPFPQDKNCPEEFAIQYCVDTMNAGNAQEHWRTSYLNFRLLFKVTHFFSSPLPFVLFELYGICLCWLLGLFKYLFNYKLPSFPDISI